MGKWRGGKGRAPKLLLNQGPSKPCYANDCIIILLPAGHLFKSSDVSRTYSKVVISSEKSRGVTRSI